ncbi:MAG: hypothetical protein AB7K71_28420 [Polyangiaceae bacterium]
MLRILTESGRPMTVRTLALASTLPLDVATEVVRGLVGDGLVTMRRDEVALAGPRSVEPTNEPAPLEQPKNVHQFVVRRNGERVKRLAE